MDLFDDSESESESESKSDSEIEILLPVTEIPKSLKFNHQSFGNSISFKIGCKFPKVAVCFPTFPSGSAMGHIGRYLTVHVSINGCKQILNSRSSSERYEEQWLFSKYLGMFNKPNLSEQNHVEVKCEIRDGLSRTSPKWFRNQILLTCRFRVTGMVVGHPQF